MAHQLHGSTSFTFRCNEDLLDNFIDCCRGNDLTAAQVLRSAMRKYIEANRQTDAFKQYKGDKK